MEVSFFSPLSIQPVHVARAVGKVYISACESSAWFLATEWYRNFHTFCERTFCAPSIMTAWQTSKSTMCCQQKFQINFSQLHSFSLPGEQVQCPVNYIILLLDGKEKVEVFLSSKCVSFPFFQSDCWVDLLSTGASLTETPVLGSLRGFYPLC